MWRIGDYGRLSQYSLWDQETSVSGALCKRFGIGIGNLIRGEHLGLERGRETRLRLGLQVDGLTVSGDVGLGIQFVIQALGQSIPCLGLGMHQMEHGFIAEGASPVD